MSLDRDLTEDDIARATFRYTVHYNLGDRKHAYEHQCVEYPRLSFVDRKEGRTWKVDDAMPELATLSEALDALCVPPSIGAEQEALLRSIPFVWCLERELKAEYAGPPAEPGVIVSGTPYATATSDLIALCRCGLIEYGRAPGDIAGVFNVTIRRIVHADYTVAGASGPS